MVDGEDGTPEDKPSPSLPWLLLGLALCLAAAAARGAAVLDPPTNDLLFHGVLVDGALQALRDGSWTRFQDPWFDAADGGFPYFHVYPHAMHQAEAVAGFLLGLTGQQSLALGAAVASGRAE